MQRVQSPTKKFKNKDTKIGMYKNARSFIAFIAMCGRQGATSVKD